MKYLLFFLAIVIVSACANMKANKPHVEVMNAYSQKWFGGAAGSGYGTNYTFKLKKNTSESISFDTIWIQERAYIPEMQNITNPGAAPDSGDEFYLKMQYRYRDNEYTGEVSESPPKSDGPAYEGDALIIYRMNGERKTIVVKQMNVEEPLFYP